MLKHNKLSAPAQQLKIQEWKEALLGRLVLSFPKPYRYDSSNSTFFFQSIANNQRVDMDQATTIYMLPIGGGIRLALNKQRIRPYCSIQPPLFRYLPTVHGVSFEMASPHFGNHSPVLFDSRRLWISFVVLG